jgi:hypothetical protein
MHCQVFICQLLCNYAFDIIFLMEQYTDSQEPWVMGDEDKVTPRIRGLRVLARIIARDLLHSKRDDRDNNNTTTDDLRERLTHDEGLSGT